MSSSTSTSVPEVRKDRYRVVGLMAKKPGLTDEQFFAHWREVNGPLFTSLEIVKKNILKYEQHHYNNSFEAGIAANGYALPQEYRGVAVFEAESYEKILEVFLSEEYKRLAYDDELNFLDRSKSVFLPGSLITYIDRS
ncbi:hypothetical protein C8Q77DRAFT_1217856 [Trametes polyzona]|nr:hypothetical protein C8Q77DRAFT_1217856 [Trametes polyzona]